MSHLPLARLFRSDPTKVRITGVELAKQSLELAIHMQSGEVLVYKFGEADARMAMTEPTQVHTEGYFPSSTPADTKAEHVEELTSTAHLANWKSDGFKPATVLTTRRGPVVDIAMSDIGKSCSFLQVSLLTLFSRFPSRCVRAEISHRRRSTWPRCYTP
jgi:hypothetical protein